MVKSFEKLVFYILIILGVGFAGFMAYKSFTEEAEIVEAKGNALYETIKTPFESTFGTKDDPTKVVFKKGDSVLTFNLPYENIEWVKTNSGLVANINKAISFSYSIFNSSKGDPIGIKEEIILNEKPETNEFEFSLNLQGLTAKKDGGLWRFYDDSEKEVFYIPKPFMEDANGNRSNDVDIKINNGKLLVSADQSWLNSDERKYPIKIDPTLQLTVLTLKSQPEVGDIWSVEFTTQGQADLKIIPNDQQTIDDMDFVKLTCGGQEKYPRILKDDVILYRNWECDDIAKVEHLINIRGNHELKFEFGGEVGYAHNASWLGTWENRIEITVDNTNIDSDLDHFPVPIFLNTSAGQNNDDVSAVFDEVGANWQKIAVTKDDGTSQLYVEKEMWDDTGEEAVLWVSNSGFTLSNAATTTLYLYYDAAQDNNTLYTGDVGSRTEVWDNYYKGVWHMSEGGGTAVDSTSNDNDLSDNASATGTTGVIGNGQEFDGLDDYYSVAISLSEFAVQLAAYLDGTVDNHFIGGMGDSGGDFQELEATSLLDSTDRVRARSNGTEGLSSSATNPAPMDQSSFNFAVGTWQGATSRELYYNGTSAGEDTTTITSTNSQFVIGTRASTSFSPAKGYLDEIRLSSSIRSDAWWKTDYYAQTDDLLTFGTPSTYTATSSTEASWLPNWSKRMKITIDNSNIDSSLTHFPIPIILSTSSGQFDEDVSAVFDELETNWQKIAVTEDDGITQLYVEKEKWDDTGEEAVLWVSKSDFTISSSATTTLYIYYDSTQSNNNDYVGGPGSGQAKRTEVWDSDYLGVFHMSEASGNLVDSTSNSYNSTTINGSPVYEQTGQLGYSIDFEAGSSESFEFGTQFGTPTLFTVQTLIKPESTPNTGIVFSGPSSGANDESWGLYTSDASDYVNVQIGNDTNEQRLQVGSYWNATDFPSSEFTMLHAIAEGNGNDLILYDNGTLKDSTTQNYANSSAADILAIGGLGDYSGYYYDGLMDEVRISDAVRSVAWVKADYYAMFDNLLSYGAEETSTTTSSSGGSNYFGDSSDGTANFTTDTSFTNTADGDYVVKQYDGLTIDSGVTVTTANRAKGLMILVDGDATINGTLSMTARGAYADPTTEGVSATGLRLPMVKSGETDTLSAADFSGAGTTVQSVVSNQSGIDGDGKIYQIPRTGASGSSAAGADGTDGTGGQTGGGSAGGGGGDGGDGTCFSGGSGGGNSNADDIAGPGGANSCYYSSRGGSAGNPSGAACCYGGSCGGTSWADEGIDGNGGVVWLIVRGDLTIGATGVIEANGGDGGDTWYTEGGGGGKGGGASAGGSIFVLYAGTLSNSGTVEALGGIGGTGNTTDAGDGGDGTVTIEQVTGNVAPSAPTSLKTEGEVNPTNITDSTPEFTATYNDADTGDIADKYQIQVDDNSDFSSTIWDSGSSGTAMSNCTAGNECSEISYAGSSLSEGVTYYWRIKFWDDDGAEGSWSTETATFSLILVPTGCRVKEIAQNGSNYDITLEWTDNSSTETGFEIDRNTDGAGWTDLTTTAADTTTYDDTNLATGSEYAYRVRANSAAGDSDWCYISGYDLNTGNFNFEGLDFEGINID